MEGEGGGGGGGEELVEVEGEGGGEAVSLPPPPLQWRHTKRTGWSQPWCMTSPSAESRGQVPFLPPSQQVKPSWEHTARAAAVGCKKGSSKIRLEGRRHLETSRSQLARDMQLSEPVCVPGSWSKQGARMHGQSSYPTLLLVWAHTRAKPHSLRPLVLVYGTSS